MLVTDTMSPYKIKMEVVEILGTGNCSIEQKVGDTYDFPEDKGKMCSSSFYVLYPWILVMQSGGRFSFFGDDDSVTVGCPDHTHQVVYKITREETE
ncbi:MAG: TIGR04076 family protein [Candidatus Thorarchaeota archaeon]